MRMPAAALLLAAAGSAPALEQVRRPQVLEAHHHDRSPPLWLMRPAEPLAEVVEHEPMRIPLVARRRSVRDTAVQPQAPAPSALQTGLSFEGIGDGLAGVPPATTFRVFAIPPDPNGDVGPNHYLQIVNSSFAVFGKTGVLQYGPVPTRTIFQGFGGACETHDDGDGVVLYDPMANRWLLTQFAIVSNSSGPFLQCVAVSATPDPAGSWNRYAFTFTSFNDYGKFGVWPDAYYATYNLFTSAQPGNASFVGTAVCAMDRAKMLEGAYATQQCVVIPPKDTMSGMTPADLDGPRAPPLGEPAFILAYDTDTLALFRYHVDWSQPQASALTGPISIAVAPFTPACPPTPTDTSGACIPQPGFGAKLDSLSDRMMFRVAYRNHPDGHESLVANHSVLGPGGVASAVRWYEMQDPAGKPTVSRQGTYSPSDGVSAWMGSAAMDGAGNVAIGYSVSNSSQHPGIRFAGVAGQGEGTIFTGAGSQAPARFSRWGDYSSLSIDPADDCTFWYTNQYIPADGSFNWHTRIASFALPGCTAAADFMLWMTPDTREVARPLGATYTVSSAALRPTANGKSLALAVSAMPTGISASVAPSPIHPGETATLTISVGAGASVGAVPLSVTATAMPPAAADVSTAVGHLRILGSDFSLSAAAPSVTVTAGGSATETFTTAALAGPAESIAFAADNLPAGVTAAFDPPTVTTGQSTVGRFTGPPGMAAARSAAIVRATSPSTTHTANVQVTALIKPGAAISLLSDTDLAGTQDVFVYAAISTFANLAALDLLVDSADSHASRRFDSTRSSWAFSWDTKSVSNGPHDLTARITDDAGNVAISPVVHVTVKNRGACGCSGDAGGWEALALLAAVALGLSRRQRPAVDRRSSASTK